jgi:integrase/recombinase XerC
MSPQESSSLNLDLLLEQFTAYLKVEKNVSPHTLEGYSHDLLEFAYFLAEQKSCQIEELKPDEVEYPSVRQFLAVLQKKGLKKTTIARKLASLRSFFRFLSQEELVTRNPVKHVETPKLEKKIPRFLYYQQIERLLNAPDNTPQGQRDKAILETIYAGGLRVSELVGLDIDAIDFAIGYARVFGKGAKERVVPLGKPALEALKAYLDHGRTVLAAKSAAKARAAANAYGPPDPTAVMLSSGSITSPLPDNTKIASLLATINNASKRRKYLSKRHSLASSTAAFCRLPRYCSNLASNFSNKVKASATEPANPANT